MQLPYHDTGISISLEAMTTEKPGQSQGFPTEVQRDPDMWASCVGGAEPKDTYLERIKGAGFSQVEVVGEVAYRRSVVEESPEHQRTGDEARRLNAIPG